MMTSSSSSGVSCGEPLARYTSLRLGGSAARWVRAESEPELCAAFREADARREPVALLGGGSNVLVSDEGVAGQVIHPAFGGVEVRRRDGGHVLLDVAAGEPWSRLVDRCVEEGWQGLECLAGIPGSCGAAPVQNIGAYGAELSDVLQAVKLYDRCRGEAGWVAAAALRLGYRRSVLRARPGRYVVLALRLRLSPGAPAAVRYEALKVRLGLGPSSPAPPIAAVREAVLSLRAERGMLLDGKGPGSVGSFFVNPIVGREGLQRVLAGALRCGAIARAEALPRWPQGEARWKLPAAWLIERAGFDKGYRRGPVGISERHALALVHHGGGRTAELVALARAVRSAVASRFGVGLRREPVWLRAEPLRLDAPDLPLLPEAP